MRAAAAPEPAGMGSALAGKWCVVTGASKGIGHAVSLALAKEHGRLILVARSEERLKQVCGEAKAAGAERAEPVIAALDTRSGADDAIAKIQDLIQSDPDHCPLHMLVNNAGVFGGSKQTPLEGSPDEFESMMYTNLMAPMRMTRALAPRLVEAGQGLLVNVSSLAGLTGMASAAAYGASKFGLRGWSKCCYEELRKHNIKVMCICPGFVDTPMVASHPGVDHSRMIRPEDVAAAVLLGVHSSAGCCPEEIVLRNVLPVGGG